MYNNSGERRMTTLESKQMFMSIYYLLHVRKDFGLSFGPILLITTGGEKRV
jgi:hypothetical protein